MNPWLHECLAWNSFSNSLSTSASTHSWMHSLMNAWAHDWLEAEGDCEASTTTTSPLNRTFSWFSFRLLFCFTFCLKYGWILHRFFTDTCHTNTDWDGFLLVFRPLTLLEVSEHLSLTGDQAAAEFSAWDESYQRSAFLFYRFQRELHASQRMSEKSRIRAETSMLPLSRHRWNLDYSVVNCPFQTSSKTNVALNQALVKIVFLITRRRLQNPNQSWRKFSIHFRDYRAFRKFCKRLT